MIKQFYTCLAPDSAPLSLGGASMDATNRGFNKFDVWMNSQSNNSVFSGIQEFEYANTGSLFDFRAPVSPMDTCPGLLMNSRVQRIRT